MRLLVALHHRGRIALRRGRLEEASRWNAAARVLAERLEDRIEIGELRLEEGDLALYRGDLEAARLAWNAAAGAPRGPHRAAHARHSSRLAALDARVLGDAPPALAEREAMERDLSRDPYAAAERAARWQCLYGPRRSPRSCGSKSVSILRALGRRGPGEPGLRRRARRSEARPGGDSATSFVARSRAATANGRDALGALGLVGHRRPRRGGPRGARSSASGERRDGSASTPRLRVARARNRSGAALDAGVAAAVGGDRGGVDAAPRDAALRGDPAPDASDAPDGDFSDALAPARRRHRGRLDGGAVRAARAVRAAVGHGAGARRVGLREGGDRARHPRPVAASRRTVRARQRPRDPRRARGERALRPRPRRVHRRRSRPARAPRGGRRAGRSSSTRSATWRSPSRRSSCARCRSARSAGSGRTARARSTSASCPRPPATWRAEAEAGRFREDLYYRLHVAVIRLPPLRERGGDALRLARHFLARFAREYGKGELRLAADAAAAVAAHPWPGNVRELQNAMAQAAALCDGNCRRRRGPPSGMRAPEARRRSSVRRVSCPPRRAPPRPDLRRARPRQRQPQPRGARSGPVAAGAAVFDQGAEGGGAEKRKP